MNAAPAPSVHAGGQLDLLAARTRLSLLTGLLAGLAAGIYTAVYLAQAAPSPPVSGGPSAPVALLVLLAIILPGLATLLSFRYLPASQAGVHSGASGGSRAPGWLNRLVCAAITGAACGWATWLLIMVLTPVVPGTPPGRPALVFTVGLCAGLLAAVTAFASAAISRRGLLLRLGLMLGLGLLVAMLLAQDMRWWRDSLSYMGRAGSAGRVFSTTMILAGLGLCGVVLEMGAGLRRLAEVGRFPPRAAAWLSALLTVASLGLIAIGIFPSNDDPVSLALHRLLGNGALVVFVGVMCALRWLAPPFGRTAHLASAVIGAANVCAFGLYKAGVLNFVWFELLNVALLMAWLFLFEAYYGSLIEGLAPAP